MTIIRHLVGPFHPLTKSDSMKWHFIGMRDTYHVAHWTLSLDLAKREWTTNSTKLNTFDHNMPLRRVNEALKKSGWDPKVVRHPDMMLGAKDEPPREADTITELLRARLTSSELARATAAMLSRRR